MQSSPVLGLRRVSELSQVFLNKKPDIGWGREGENEEGISYADG
jgi:hypothetical protein